MSDIQLPEDDIIRDMLPDFVESWRRDMRETFPSLLESKNAEELYRMGHTLRGSGRQFGLNTMSEYGSIMQEHARAEAWSQLSQLATTIEKELNNVQLYLIQNGITPADRFSVVPSNL